MGEVKDWDHVRVQGRGDDGEIWEATCLLRIAANQSHRGRPERLQQKWFCRTTGKTEWRDVPIEPDHID